MKREQDHSKYQNWIDPNEVRPYERNVKIHTDKQVANIARSIKKFGWQQDTVITRDKVLVIGHGRRLAALKLGCEMPYHVVDKDADELTEKDIRELRIADNLSNSETGYDFDLGAVEIADLEFDGFDFDLSEWGNSEDELKEVVEDEPPEKVETRCKMGDIWQMGGVHRLMCGDSTSQRDMDALMNGEYPVMVFTDPPYGVAIGDKNALLKEHNGAKKSTVITKNIEGDTLSTDDLREMLTAAMSNLRAHCDESCSYYVSAPQGGELGMMMMMMKDAGLEVRHNIIWVKNAPTFSMGRLDYDYKHEPIFYTWTERHNFYGGYSATVIDDTTPYDKMTKAELKDVVRALTKDREESVIYCDKPVRSALHPTMKPVKLVARFVHNSSKRGDLCADIFGGSGTTLIASEQLGRRCNIMELDSHYCDVILQRWENLTGKKAELVSRRDEEG